MSKEALLIIDMLNNFVLKGAPLEVPDTRKVISAIKGEIERARKVERGIAGIAKEDHDAALRIMKNVMGVKII